MRTIVLTAAALVLTAASAGAQTAHRSQPSRQVPGGYEHFVPMQTAPAAPADNTRASFAAHVGANGQGTY